MMRPEQHSPIDVTGRLAFESSDCPGLRAFLKAELLSQNILDPEACLLGERCHLTLRGVSERGASVAVFRFERSGSVQVPLAAIGEEVQLELDQLLTARVEAADVLGGLSFPARGREFSQDLDEQVVASPLLIALRAFDDLSHELDPPPLTPDFSILLQQRAALIAGLYSAGYRELAERSTDELLALIPEQTSTSQRNKLLLSF